MDKNTTREIKVPVKRGKRVKKGDYQSSNTLNATGLEKWLKFVNGYMLETGLHFASVRDLINIYLHYKATNVGLNPYGIVCASGASGSVFNALYIRLGILKARGLVSVVDGRYYIPTEKAIAELSAICVD